MTFDEVLEKIQELLQREQRVSYRGLKRRFDLDDEYLEDLKEELIGAKRIAVDEEGRFLVWTGASTVLSPESRVLSPPQPPIPSTQHPINYTPSHLAERIRAEQAALEARGATDGERKTITALFADLKGSTALIEGLDPEEARAIIDPALQLMMDAVHQYDGYVAQALGDGIFALFGAPLAHEDHPQRAVYAALLLGAHLALGITSFWQGEMSLAREHLEQGIALYDPQRRRSLTFVYGTDAGMTCRIHAAWVLWLLGYPDQALKRSHEAITLAQELSHPYSLSFVLQFAADLHRFRREWRLVQERAEAAMALSSEQGFAMALSRAAILRGWTLAEHGQGKDGIVQMQQGLAAYRETGAKLIGSYYLALLAEAHGKVGQTEEGLSILAEALSQVDKTGERFYEAELYRIKGELLLAQEIKNQKGKSQKLLIPDP